MSSGPKNYRMCNMVLRKLALPFLVLGCWVMATTFWTIHPIILPKLQAVVRDFFFYVQSGELLEHAVISLRRCLLGLVGGSTLGIFMGILLGWNRYLEEIFDVSVNFTRSIPKTALAPLFIVWFGFEEMPKVLLIGLASYFYTLIPTMEGVKNVDKLYIKSARSLGAKDFQILLSVVIPAAMPAMYAGLRLATATALVVLVFVEILTGNSGLGYLLEMSRSSLNMSTMYMTLVVLGVIGFILDWLVRRSETWLMPWQKGRTLSS